jgi:hypothetical protein
MAIPSSISIPNLYVQDPFSSALQQGLGSFQKSMQMKQQQDQFNKQQGLREQLAQMQMQQGHPCTTDAGSTKSSNGHDVQT